MVFILFTQVGMGDDSYNYHNLSMNTHSVIDQFDVL